MDYMNNQKGRNLYKQDGRYYRLFARGVTPNGCWLINPQFTELVDIDIRTNRDVFGSDSILMETGTVDGHREYIINK